MPHPPFFHIGSDETATLGLGRTHAYVARRGLSQAFADHVAAMNRAIAPSGARIMLWDDAVEKDPGIMKLLPPGAVIVNYHYEAQSEPFAAVHRASSRAAVSRRWSRPARATGTRSFRPSTPLSPTSAASSARGNVHASSALFETVWHDDGETLYEATWYPVLYAAAASWQSGDVEPQAFAARFPERVLRR